MKNFFIKNWVYFVIVFIMVIFTMSYFSPQFDGYTLKQHDIEQYVGAANEANHFKENTGNEQLWTNSMFGGMPTTQISMIHTGNFIGRTMLNFVNLFPAPSGMVFLHMLCFFIMLMCFRVNPWIALIGSIAFAFSTYEIIILQAGHNSKSLAVAFIAPILGGFYMSYRYKKWLGIGLSSLFMTLELACNHIQVTYYFMFLLLGLGIVELILAVNKGVFKRFMFVSVGLIIAYTLAVLVNIGNIYLTNEYAKNTIRGGNDITITPTNEKATAISSTGLDKDYITQWSYGKGETFTLISPYVKGGGSVVFNESPFVDVVEDMDISFDEKNKLLSYPVYWGDQPFTSGPFYLGAVVFFLAFLGMFFIKEPYKWAFVVISVLSILLAWGKNLMGFTDFFLDYVPGYNKFRTVTIILVLVELIVPLLAVLFLQYLYRNREEIIAKKRLFFIASGIFLFILILIKFVGLGDNYTSNFDKDQIARIETQINTQITSIDAATLMQNYKIDKNNPQQLNDFVQAQLEPYNKMFENARDAREEVFHQSMNRTIIFAVLTIGLLLLLVFSSISYMYILSGIGLLIVIDLLSVSLNYLNKDEKYWIDKNAKSYPYSTDAMDEQILANELTANPKLQPIIEKSRKKGIEKAEDLNLEGSEKNKVVNSEIFSALNANTNYRIFDLTTSSQSAQRSYFHKSLGGYHGAKLRNIQNIYEFHLNSINNEVFNMLNVKYFIQQTDQGLKLSDNPDALGNAWFVQSLREVENRNDELLALGKIFEISNIGDGKLLVNNKEVKNAQVYGREKLIYLNNKDSIKINLSNGVKENFSVNVVIDANGVVNSVPEAVMQSDTALKSFKSLVSYKVTEAFEPSKEAIISKDNSTDLKKRSFSGEGEIKMTSYSPMELKYSAKTNSDQFIVFSEIYYPEWKAKIDGKDVEIFNVDYCLRGIQLPQGNHEITMYYDDSLYSKVNNFSFLLAIFVLALLGFTIWKQRKTDQKEIELP